MKEWLRVWTTIYLKVLTSLRAYVISVVCGVSYAYAGADSEMNIFVMTFDQTEEAKDVFSYYEVIYKNRVRSYSYSMRHNLHNSVSGYLKPKMLAFVACRTSIK